MTETPWEQVTEALTVALATYIGIATVALLILVAGSSLLELIAARLFARSVMRAAAPRTNREQATQ